MQWIRLSEKLRGITKQYVSIHNRGNVFAINLKVVLFVESINHSQFIHSINEHPIELRMTMSELFETLSHSSGDFHRVGKAYIVNLKQIRQLSSKESDISWRKASQCSSRGI